MNDFKVLDKYLAKNNILDNSELEKLKKENLLLKQQLADAKQEINSLKNNKTNINPEVITKIVQKAILEGAKKAEDDVQDSISNINGYLIGIIKRFNNMQNGLNKGVDTVNYFFWILGGIMLLNVSCFAYILYRLNALESAINLTNNNITWYFNGLINALNIWSFFK